MGAKIKKEDLKIKHCCYRHKLRCLVFKSMCSYPPNAPLKLCGQAPDPDRKLPKRGKK